MISIAAILLALSSVLCLVLIKRGNQVHGEGDAAGKYERVSLMVRRERVRMCVLRYVHDNKSTRS